MPSKPLLTALLLAGCATPGPHAAPIPQDAFGDSCRAAAAKLTELSGRGGAVRQAWARACYENQWSQEHRDCFAEASSNDAVDRCDVSGEIIGGYEEFLEN